MTTRDPAASTDKRKNQNALTDMTAVRAAIDDVDRRIVPLLLERLGYIERAGEIKQERSAVRDEWRIEDVLAKVAKTATAEGGNEAYIREIYRQLIDYSIAHEYTVFDKK